MPSRLARLACLVCLPAFCACSDDDGETRPTKTCQAQCNNASVDCPAHAPLCVDKKCVTCQTDSDCNTGFKCNTKTGVCNYCESDADCSTSYYLGCNTATGVCVHCRKDTDCMSTGGAKVGTGKCVVALGQCIGCTIDSDCAPAAYNYCKDGSCSVQCKSDADCATSIEGTKWCDEATGRCTGCETDLDCDAFDIQLYGKHHCL